jgi:hypothetical protein
MALAPRVKNEQPLMRVDDLDQKFAPTADAEKSLSRG